MAALTILLGGVDITLNADQSSVVMQLAGGQEVATCEFDLVDTTNTVSCTDEMTLSLTEVSSATVLFGGFVRSSSVIVIATGRIIHVKAVDYNSLLDRSIVVSDSRSAGESDHARLVYLMTTYGSQFSSDYTQIATLNGSMPAQKFIAITLRQAIERVLGQASTKSSYYCDPTGRLVTYDRSVVTAAPFNVRVGTPGGGEIAPEDFSVDQDSSNLANAIYVVGATAAGSGWFTDTTSISTYGRRERFFNAPDADTAAKAKQVGLAVLEDQKNPLPRGVFTTKSPKDGWRIGQSIVVTSTQHNLSAVTYRIARVTVHYLSGAGDREYTIELGAPLATLSALLGATHGGGGGFPWHSPGGSGGWVSPLGSGTPGGGISGGGNCACNTPYGMSTFDSFSRSLSGSWGTSDAGTVWTNPFGTGSTTVGVSSGVGYTTAANNDGTTFQTITSSGPWTNTAGFVMLAIITVNVIPTVGYANLALYSGSGGIGLHISSAGGSGKVNLGSDTVAKTDWVAGSYYLRWEFDSLHSRLRVWRVGLSEPSTWTLEEAVIGSTMNTQLNVGMDNTGTGLGSVTLGVDDISFAPAVPNSGQPYPWTNLGNGNNSQITFSTLTAFRAGSLEVRLDSTPITPIAQTPDNGSGAGTFTLSFAPPSNESVWARWTTA